MNEEPAQPLMAPAEALYWTAWNAFITHLRNYGKPTALLTLDAMQTGKACPVMRIEFDATGCSIEGSIRVGGDSQRMFSQRVEAPLRPPSDAH